MTRTVLRRIVVLALLAAAPPARGQESPAFRTAVKPLLDTHCVDCHGPDVKKAGLRLDNLSADFRNERAAAVWVKVHDKIASGEMPPKKSDQPPRAVLNNAIGTLQRELHAASLDRQQTQGRVVLRRLNGTEYENTVHDLLAVRVPLKDMLPDDNSAAGFDNVSAALDLSPTHLLAYQEAAEKAVLAAIPPHPFVPFRDRRSGKEMTDKGPNFRQSLGRSCRVIGDGLAIYSKLPRYGLCQTAAVPADGRYKVRMSVAAVGNDGKPVPAAFLTVDQGRDGPVVKEIRDIPNGKPAVVELEIDLTRRQAFVVNVLSNWDIRGFKKPIEEYTGPGVLLEWLEIEGPVGRFPPPSYDALFAGVPLKARSVVKAEAEGKKEPRIDPNRSVVNWLNDPLVPTSANPKADADRLIRSFLPRAFRRPVGNDMAKAFVARVHERLDRKETFLDAMTFGYKCALSSPHFLLFEEAGSGTPAASGDLSSPRLDPFAVANRLSYFLWSGPPDDALTAAARTGELLKPDGLHGQVERMLANPKAQRFTGNFTGQWLDLRQIDATIPDPHLYGDFDGTLLWAMPRETRAFFDEILANDRSLLEFVDSDWSMLNERLAAHYGIPGVCGNHLRKVTLPAGSHRGGVMTQASVLKVTADGTKTSPTLRGKWVLDRIVGQPPAPPPPDVPALEPDIRGATTVRQQLEKHRTNAACAACHVHIDPPGFALEAFDPIGGYRDFYRAPSGNRKKTVPVSFHVSRPVYRGPDVDATGMTPDGRAFAGIEGYKKLLLTDKDQLARSLTQKVIVYATGADVQFADREEVERIVAALRAKDYGFRTLVHEVVRSRVFLNK